MLAILFCANTVSPILVTPSGIITFVSWLSENAPSPILVTLAGIDTLVRLLFLNASVPIPVTEITA
jgi:hypothetical protein